jgi:hypothetical protein
MKTFRKRNDYWQEWEENHMSKRAFLISMTFLIVLILFITGCGPRMITKSQKFPLMYEETPASILILPPMNESTAADAKDYYATTIQEPLSFCGYYVFPYEVTTEILKMEGLYDSELLRSIPLAKFREYFGADAVLFTTIKKWNLSYLVLASTLTVSIDCELKSTKSDQILWRYNGTVVVDLSGGSSGGGIIGLVVKAVATAVASAAADYVPHARTANYRALSTMPYGKHHPQYMKDQEQQFPEQVSK